MSKVLHIGKHLPSALQASFAFPTPAISLTVEHSYERHALRVILALLALCLFAYLYFVSASILNVIARREATTHMASLRNVISASEQRYFELSQAITPERGTTIGLSTISETSYVYRPGNTALAQ